MAPERTAATTTTPVTAVQLKALIARGVDDALEEIGVNKPAKMAMTTMILELVAEEQSKLLLSATTVTSLNWNSHVKTVTHEVAYAIPWKTLKNMMTDKYCPRGEIKKLEIEMWNLKVKGTDVKYVGGLPGMIHGSVMASKPKTMQDTIEFATELMDKEISTLAERQAEKKRKLNNNNQAPQQPPKKQGVAISYNVGSGERNEYAGTLPLCKKCKFHHNGQVHCKVRKL
nr:hypothetical protein [Tanacetum cinerariifolium]